MKKAIKFIPMSDTDRRESVDAQQNVRSTKYRFCDLVSKLSISRKNKDDKGLFAHCIQSFPNAQVVQTS